VEKVEKEKQYANEEVVQVTGFRRLVI